MPEVRFREPRERDVLFSLRPPGYPERGGVFHRPARRHNLPEPQLRLHRTAAQRGEGVNGHRLFVAIFLGYSGDLLLHAPKRLPLPLPEMRHANRGAELAARAKHKRLRTDARSVAIKRKSKSKQFDIHLNASGEN